MKQTIEIEVPKGKKAIWKNNKMIFEDIVSNLPKTWEEFCNNNEIKSNEHFIGNNSTICYWIGTKYRQPTCKNMLPSKEAAEQHLALMQLHQLRDCYRQGWKPNIIEESFNIVRKVDSPLVIRRIDSCDFLSFQSKEIAEKFLINFYNLINKAGDLI